MRRLITGSILAAAIVGGSVTQAVALSGAGSGPYTFPMVCDGKPVMLTIASGVWSAAYVRETGMRFLPTIGRARRASMPTRTTACRSRSSSTANSSDGAHSAASIEA